MAHETEPILDISGLFPQSEPVLVNVSRLVAVERSRAPGQPEMFRMSVDYQRESFYTEAKYVGHGELTPRYDFVNAIRQFII